MTLQTVIRLPTAWSSADEGWAVHLFEGELTVADMDRMQHSGDRWAMRNAGKRAELVIIHPSAARVSAEERARMARLMKHGEARRSASATVILADGVLGALQRSTLTALMMVAPASHPAKVFGSTSDALRWLFPYVQSLTPNFVGAEELELALTEHLKEFRARPRP
jgi:hypothetical protein